MEELNSIIADNLKEIRTKRGLSLDHVSALTGVSKSMLGQIERKESNPTIATVWKIANGLKISFTSLVQKPVQENKVIYKSEVTPVIEDEGRCNIYPFFPFEEGRKFEMFQVVMKPNGRLEAEAHNKDTLEMVIVFDGKLEIVIEGVAYLICKDDAFEFRADKMHSYFNPGDQETRMAMVIYYPE
ncbi:MAG: helix-turn-helix transcriptional regulator [Tissierellales bacterium]|nr:helix-turn-helix transcriptional regulator [Tissierellales bacterium]MBN2827270.1 helix-turn-helix transcriptional regulator [Tissierellales bacterium]